MIIKWRVFWFWADDFIDYMPLWLIVKIIWTFPIYGGLPVGQTWLCLVVSGTRALATDSVSPVVCEDGPRTSCDTSERSWGFWDHVEVVSCFSLGVGISWFNLILRSTIWFLYRLSCTFPYMILKNNNSIWVCYSEFSNHLTVERQYGCVSEVMPRWYFESWL